MSKVEANQGLYAFRINPKSLEPVLKNQKKTLKIWQKPGPIMLERRAKYFEIPF